MTRRSSRRNRASAAGVLALIALVLAACSAGGDDAAMDGGETVTQEASDAIEEERAVADDAAGVDADEGAASGPEPTAVGDGSDRAVIRTGSIHLRVTDTGAAAEEIPRIATGAGGYVAGTDLQRDDEGVVRGWFSLRVPAERLDATLDELDALADTVLERRTDETDVTTELADLDAQLENLAAYEDELRQLLGDVREADDVEAEGIVRVYDRINDVRMEIDRITARRTVLADRVAMATIEIQLSPTPASTPVGVTGWDPGETAQGALAATVRALAAIADVAIRLVLTVLPVALVILVPVAVLGLAARAVVRRRRTTAAEPAHDANASDADRREDA